MRTVLHLLVGEQYSGLERVVDHLVDRAASHGFDAAMVLLHPQADPARIRSTPRVVHRVPMRHRADLGVLKALCRLVGELQPSLVHSHTVRSALIAAPLTRIAGLPWVHHVHSPARFESERRGMNLVNALVERVTLPMADVVFPVSTGLASYVRETYGVRADRIEVVCNGVPDIPVANRLPHDDARGGFRVVSAGLFRPRKGIEHLIDAIAKLAPSNPDIDLLLVGGFVSPAYEAAVRDRAARSGAGERVRFAGHVSDVGPALRAADVFVIPSLYGEGIPMAMLEAMAHGLPVVGSAVAGIREVVGSEAGRVVPPADSDALAAALQALAGQPALRRRLGEAARSRQRSRYSVASMARGVYDAYERVLAGGRGAPLPMSR